MYQFVDYQTDRKVAIEDVPDNKGEILFFDEIKEVEGYKVTGFTGDYLEFSRFFPSLGSAMNFIENLGVFEFGDYRKRHIGDMHFLNPNAKQD